MSSSLQVQLVLAAVSVSLLCRPGKLSQFSSPLGSANDPIFWPLHINWERNWAYVRLARHFNSTWGNNMDDASMPDGMVGWDFHDPLQVRHTRSHDAI